MRSTRRGCVCVFAKPPRAGLVKTRLIASLGAPAAADLARAFFDDTWRLARSLEWADAVLATTDVAASEWQTIGPAEIWPQVGGDLGERLEEILRDALAIYPFAIAIGTDAPALPRELLDAACDALQTVDAVLGPAEDGGFYLLGVRACPSGLLAEIPWSAPDTYARTLARFRERRLRTEILPPWFDVDRSEDLNRLTSLLASAGAEAPATRRLLQQLGMLPDGPAGVTQ
ncbi:MAG: TIGR04282 family arsenosugar biosynthesis glycosyltransferase [Vicinamibacterales bacterium]